MEFSKILKSYLQQEVIKKNHKKQSVFSSNLSKIDAIEFVNLEEKKQTVREMLINGYADSFLVLKKGEIILKSISMECRKSLFIF